MRAQKTTRHSTRGSTRRPAEKDAIALLKEDHEKVRELLPHASEEAVHRDYFVLT